MHQDKACENLTLPQASRISEEWAPEFLFDETSGKESSGFIPAIQYFLLVQAFTCSAEDMRAKRRLRDSAIEFLPKVISILGPHIHSEVGDHYINSRIRWADNCRTIN